MAILRRLVEILAAKTKRAFGYAPAKEPEPGGFYRFRHCQLLAALYRQQLFPHPAAHV